MPKIVIGCKLPNGITLKHPNPEVGTSVTLAGLHTSKLVTRSGAPASSFVTTEVDADFWEAWKNAYSTYTPLKNGSIFEARNESEAIAKGKELSKVKTGFEPLKPESHGVAPVDKKDK